VQVAEEPVGPGLVEHDRPVPAGEAALLRPGLDDGDAERAVVGPQRVREPADVGEHEGRAGVDLELGRVEALHLALAGLVERLDADGRRRVVARLDDEAGVHRRRVDAAEDLVGPRHVDLHRALGAGEDRPGVERAAAIGDGVGPVAAVGPRDRVPGGDGQHLGEDVEVDDLARRRLGGRGLGDGDERQRDGGEDAPHSVLE
jgi:hypothetical protein